MKCVKLSNGGVSHLVSLNNTRKISELTDSGFSVVNDKDGHTLVVDLNYNEYSGNDAVKAILDGIKDTTDEGEDEGLTYTRYI